MGNPSLPHLFNERSVQAGRPARLVTWQVCELRVRGNQIGRTAALATAQRGVLQILPIGGLQACLKDAQGNELKRLDSVRVRRLTGTGEMVLHGVQSIASAGRVEQWPQAWWCIVELVNFG